MPSNKYQKIFIGPGINLGKVIRMVKQNDSALVVLEAKNSLYNIRTNSISHYLIAHEGYTCIWMKKVKRKRDPEKVLKAVLVPESESKEKHNPITIKV